MIGPLPQLYRLLVIAAAVLLFIGLGVWLAHSIGVPMPFGGILGGTVAGVLMAYLLVHDFSHQHAARPLRVRRR